MQASEARRRQIGMELLQSVLQSLRHIPLLFSLLALLFAYGFSSNLPKWVVAAWFAYFVSVQLYYRRYTHRIQARRNNLDDVDRITRQLSVQYALMSLGWVLMVPLFWQSGHDNQNMVLMTVMLVHAIASSTTIYHVRPILLVSTIPTALVSLVLPLFMMSSDFRIFGFCLIPTYAFLAYTARQQRQAAEETVSLRLGNADLIRDLAAARDISESARHAAEAANERLSERENRFRALVENAFDTILVVNDQGIITYATPSMIKIGFNPETMIGKQVRDFIPAEQLATVTINSRNDNILDDRTRSREFAVTGDDHRLHHIEATITDMRKDPSIEGYVVNMRDVTQRKRNEREVESHLHVLQDLTQGRPLQEVMTRLAISAEKTHDDARAAIFLIDKDNKLTVCAAPSLPATFHLMIQQIWDNHRDKIFGTSAMAGQRIITTDMQNVAHGEDIATMARIIGAKTVWFQPIIAQSGRTVGAFALYFRQPRNPDNWELNYLRSASHIAALAVERRRADRELREAKENAELANRSKTKFLANMSHELRTPLNAIIGFSEIMESNMFGPLGSARYTEYAKDIHDSGRHLLSVIDDILDIAKIEAGKYTVQIENVDIAAIIDWSVDMVRTRTNEKHQKITRHVPNSLPVLRADQRAMRQVVLNLLSNAMKFTPERGEIGIDVELGDQGEMRLTISDNGIGIPADKIDEVLQPFGQVDDAVSRQHGGTGLGLPITKSLIEMQGGQFQLESVLGKGTRAVMTWPTGRMIARSDSNARIAY